MKTKVQLLLIRTEAGAKRIFDCINTHVCD